MNNYRQTLNLPKSGFQMKANLPKKEPQMLKKWQDLAIYQQILSSRCDYQSFILHDGPIYANGDIHIGHAINKTLKDIVVKSKTMAGFYAPFVPGWDCHGLPIALKIEKKLGKPKTAVDQQQFRKACRDYALIEVAKQRQAFERLGVFADWDHCYLTMNYEFEADIVRCFLKMLEQGYIYRGYKPVHWCFACGSALAEAEVGYQDKQSLSIDVAFEICDGNDLLSRVPSLQSLLSHLTIKRWSVLIWTTTPWTLPANQAVALHPELSYCLLYCSEHAMLVACDLVDQVISRCGNMPISVLDNTGFKGRDLEGLALYHPFLEKQVKVILSDHVTTDAGSGCVHIAPAHGLDDYYLGEKYQLPVITPVQANGCFSDEIERLRGQFIYKAEPLIIDWLKETHALIQARVINHSYPHCWRHKKPLIYRATPQWFVAMDETDEGAILGRASSNHLLKLAIEGCDDVDWFPKNSKKRMLSMLANRPDWCISRQRIWGVPLPLFIHKKTQALHPRQHELALAVADLIAQQGIDAWYDQDIQTLLGDEASDYELSCDILDVWFDSGVTHACVLKKHPNLSWPADVYLEGSDQHRGWFQTSLLTACMLYQKPPFRQVITHGFAVDGDGRKMSKSVGNVIAPDKICKTLGADILRLWVASSDYHHEMVVSDAVLQRTSETYRRIRNTAKFLLSNLYDFEPISDLLPVDKMTALDRWALQKLTILQQTIKKAYHEYRFHAVVQDLHYFCSVAMGSFYLDIIKDRLYTIAATSRARRSCQTVLFYMIEVLVRVLAPICPFTAEEIWQYIPGERDTSVFLSQWYDDFPAIGKTLVTMEDWQLFMVIRNQVNQQLEKLRQQKQLGSNLDADVCFYATANYKKLLQTFGKELRFLLITSEAKVFDFADTPASAISLESGQLSVVIKVSDDDKCLRCWQRCADVGDDPNHPNLCGRCIGNIGDCPEVRLYA